MGNFQKIGIREIKDIDLKENPSQLMVDVDFRQLRRKIKRLNRSILSETIKRMTLETLGNEAEISLWLHNCKSDSESISFCDHLDQQVKRKLSYILFNLSDLNLELDSEIRKKTLIQLNPRISPKDYEKVFCLLASKNYLGVANDVEQIKRAHVVLAHKFGLKFAATEIIYERHVQTANSSNADIKIYG